MLESAGKFEKPFQSLEGKDPSYKYDLLAKRYNNLVLGPPKAEDWISIRNLTKYLKFLYDLTLEASEEVNTELQDIFEVYQSFHDARQPTTQSQPSTTTDLPNMLEGAYANDFECEYSMTEYVGSRTELESYLKVDREPYDPKEQHMFYILGWWKTKDVKYLVLCDIASDILVVPILIVPSESAFSIGGRVLDSFRSSLSPKIVEAVICCGGWMRSSKFSSIQDGEDDLNVTMDAGKELEDGLSKLKVRMKMSEWNMKVIMEVDFLPKLMRASRPTNLHTCVFIIIIIIHFSFGYAIYVKSSLLYIYVKSSLFHIDAKTEGLKNSIEDLVVRLKNSEAISEAFYCHSSILVKKSKFFADWISNNEPGTHV
ncbi:Putative AC transposase [Linum perenne]